MCCKFIKRKVKIKMTTLVAIGCSHTYGTMLDGIQSSSLFNLQNNYAALLAKKNNFKYMNLSLPGGSNEYIHRTCIDWFTRIKKKNEDYLVLIGWTSPFRMELRYPEESEYIHTTMAKADPKYFPISLGQDPGIASSKEFKRVHSITPLLFEETKEYDMWASYAWHTQRFLEKNNVKYLMYNTCEELGITYNNKDIIERLDTKKYLHPITKNQNFLYWGLSKGFEKTECWHLKLDAHIAWKDYLDQKCKELDYYS